MPIRHCSGVRKAEKHYLLDESGKFQWLILVILESCPKCKRKILEWKGINHNGSISDQRTIREEDYDTWLQRLKLQKADKIVQPGPIVGEYTRLISGDTAKVYKKVLRDS